MASNRFLPPRNFLAASIIAALPFSGAIAQETTEETTTLDRIEVTGSRIRQVDKETAQPVLSITREEIERQGFKSVSDILQNISAAGSPAISRSQPLSSGEASGAFYVDLRYLGSQRTLVLINGKRLGITTAGLQDISSIPTAIIERVEVLKDGASSIYGSDAMAGVINIITRSNYEGAEANAYFGQYSEGDGAKQSYDFVLGFRGDRGSLTAAFEYAEEDGVWAKGRGLSAYPLSDRHPFLGWTPVSQWGALVGPARPAPLPPISYVLDRDADPRFFSNFHPQNTSAPDGDMSNANSQQHVVTPVERKSVFIDGVFDFTDNLRFRTNISYNDRTSSRQNAGYPYQSAVFSTPMSPDSYFYPIGNPVAPNPVNFTRRTWEVPRVSISNLATFRFTGALEGTFEFANRYFDWDVGVLHNRNRLQSTDYGNLSIPNVTAAVGPSFLNESGVVQCGTPETPIPLSTCVPWNPFLPYGREGQGGLTNNPALERFLFPTAQNLGDTKTSSYFVNLTGSIVELPAGDLGFAVGYEYRKEEGGFSPDAQSQAGTTTNLAAGPTRGSYSVDEVYAEVAVPILADAPFADELSLTAATRHSRFDTFGNTTNNKFGFKWKPFEDVLVRGTWAEGFRAPTISDLFGGGSQRFDSFTDPCDTVFGASRDPNSEARRRCAADPAIGPNAATFRQLQQGFVPTTTSTAQTPLAFVSGSNPRLQPETSNSKTLGIVWSPRFLDGFSATLDWWWIKIEDTIVLDNPTTILEDCYINGITDRCTFFTRHPTLGIVNTMVYGNRNAGFRETEGFDLDLLYGVDTGMGRFGVDWKSTYTVKSVFKSTNDEGVLPVPQVGQSINNTATFRVRSNLYLTWDYGDLGASFGSRYYSGIDETCLSATVFPEECSDPNHIAPYPGGSRPLNRGGSNTFHDVQFRVRVPWNATIAIGANNVFEHEPAPLYSTPNSDFTNYGGFDIGRFVYLQYKQKF